MSQYSGRGRLAAWIRVATLRIASNFLSSLRAEPRASGDVQVAPPELPELRVLEISVTTHAPLTAAILACELSGDYALMLPLRVVTAFAAAWARRLYVDSVYTAELSRRGLRWRLTLDGRRVIESQQNAVDVV